MVYDNQKKAMLRLHLAVKQVYTGSQVNDSQASLMFEY